VGLSPNEAFQGKTINGLKIDGFQFRTPVDPAVGSSLKLQYQNTTEVIPGTNVRVSDDPNVWPSGTQMKADIKIPDNATPGVWDTYFWHNDDPEGYDTLPFKVKAAPPEIAEMTPEHSRPNTSFTMTITGAHFRPIATDVRLRLGPSVNPIVATNVKVASTGDKVTCSFTIPAGTYIDANWTLMLSNADGTAMKQWFSVDAKMDVCSNSFFNMIWLHAPWITTVILYSDTGFDATKIFPLAVDFGGTFPIAVNTQDVNRDGKKDQIYYFNNMAVTLPTGYNNVSVLGASFELVELAGGGFSFRRVEAYDRVRVFKFLF